MRPRYPRSHVANRDDIDRLHADVEQLFSELWQVPRFAGTRHAFRPQVDCFRAEDPPQLTVVVELPGVDPGDVQIAATPRTLVVTGARRRPRASGRVYQQMEIEYGTFERRVALSDDVDLSRASASLSQGLLTILLPVADRPEQPERIAIVVRARG
jgi:HSP20 family protein